MWQTILVGLVVLAALVFAGRHFTRAFRTGSDCACSGCSSAGCCGGKPQETHPPCTGEPPIRE